MLFPRPQLQRDMSQLVGIDITSHPERHTIVAEGVDLAVVDRAVAAARDHAAGAPASEAIARAARTRSSASPPSGAGCRSW